jgi:hypothetical protein
MTACSQDEHDGVQTNVEATPTAPAPRAPDDDEDSSDYSDACGHAGAIHAHLSAAALT